ncbi:cytochrome P450 [Aspergillus tanneri]|uniref:Uncharacterized protein n=1 Tax=Aspergillus tanneri TaxID=1220188 RepID=A0A5M9MB51_9EURO|nr:uncharacterized protein ATNIH1004_008248 [Aspergillus tanneri]KAA8644051.1 hypothetical protein ATNIH1004_008248 [Aspergillus tanneri]
MAISVSLPTYGVAYAEILLVLVICSTLIHFVRSYWRLKHVPGPLWARFTNLQRVSWVKTKRAHEIHQATHDHYGEVVRFGPNMVSLSNPAWIPTVYPIRTGFPKGDFYRTLMPYTRKGGALPAVFNTRDEALHKKIKSPIAPLFSLSNVLSLEGFVDKAIQVMVEQLDIRFVETGESFDLADWLQYFAFDVMGTLTFSKRYGFLEQGQDVHGMLATIWNYMKTAAPMTQIPWFDELWYKNSFTAMFRKTTGFSILSIVGRFIAERTEARESNKHSEEDLGGRDMLSQFFEIQAKNPSLPKWCVTAWTFSNVIAGSDSSAVVMRTAWYNLLAKPETMNRLREELLESAARKPGGFASPFPSWKDVGDLPYLDACVNEAVRLHPPFCLPFERVVPTGGIMVGNSYIPGGTVVGMSPYVVNRHKPTFGQDADEWNPDRWMVPEERKRKLEASVLTFGAGKRVCLGRHIAMLELKKIIPVLALRYEFQLLDPRKYQVENSWFFRQHGLDVKIKRHEEQKKTDAIS